MKRLFLLIIIGMFLVGCGGGETKSGVVVNVNVKSNATATTQPQLVPAPGP